MSVSVQYEHLHTVLYNPFFVVIFVVVGVGQCESLHYLTNVFFLNKVSDFIFRLTSFEEDTVLSPAEIVSPEPVFDSEKTTREETVTTRDHEAEQPMRPRIGSSGGGAAKPAGHSTSFVQSAIYREKSSRPGSTGQTDPMKRAGKTSIYDIIKADISQRKGGIHHHVTDTYDDVADETPASPESTANTSDSPAPGKIITHHTNFNDKT